MRPLEKLILPDILRVEVQRTKSLLNEGIRLCITGGRDYTNRDCVFQTLTRQHKLERPIREIGFGCARGADSFAREWAVENSIAYRCYYADWDAIGQEAGSIRNGVMLADFKPERLFVFPGGVGTTDCARKARKAGIERDFFDVNDDPFAEARTWG